ncbi:MAG: penicillin-binding protein 2 [Bacteroidetes bacterium]|nr:penicillin-binding protein 2 [Bacteroidota bacterium]
MLEEKGYGILRPMIVVVGAILLIKLFMLQVVDPTYKLRARNNVVKIKTEYPSRGLMYDRNGKVIVYNDPVYNILVQYNKVGSVDTAGFCDLLDISRSDFERRMNKARERSPRRQVEFLRNVPPAIFARFQENLHRFEGFSYDKKDVRRYPYRGAAHVLGYISEVDNAIIDASDGYYKPGDYYGKIGLERAYEDIIRGEKGISYQVVDVFNNVQGSFNNGLEDIVPVAGRDIITSLDIDLQAFGEKLMANKVGSVVAIEPATGEILAYISSPGYDPNILSSRYRGRNYSVLASDSLKPLYNRPILAEYPPGSTFKPIMSLIAFQEGVRNPASGYKCNGGYRIPGHTVGCHDHKTLLSGRDAIRYSCNAYYCDVLKKMLHNEQYDGVEEAYKKWMEYLYQFGYGNQLNIDLQYENDGNVPTNEYYNKIYGRNRWKATTVISLAIGQGETLATPLQMANSMAIIGNKGYYYQPHLARSYIENDTLRVFNRKKNVIEIDAVYFDEVVDGMEDVLINGTAKWVFTEHLSQCGKTGTAENPHGEDHSLFVAFAPKYDPQIAIAVIVENAGYGSTYAAPIASLMMEHYVNDSIAPDRKWMVDRMINANLISNETEE